LAEKRQELENDELKMRKNNHRIQGLESRGLQLGKTMGDLLGEHKFKLSELQQHQSTRLQATESLSHLSLSHPFILHYKHFFGKPGEFDFSQVSHGRLVEQIAKMEAVYAEMGRRVNLKVE